MQRRQAQRVTKALALITVATVAAPTLARGAKTVHREVSVTTAHEYYRYHAKQGFSHFVVLDVRPAAKRRGVAIKGARALPFLDAKTSRKAFAALDHRKAYMLYCGDGERAKEALELMRALHFREVYSVKGGLAAWKRRRYPVEKIPVERIPAKRSPGSKKRPSTKR